MPVAVVLAIMLATAGIAEEPPIEFGWNDEGVAVRVQDRPANEVLQWISAATGIPIQLDPANETRLNGLYRKRTLEELLLDLSPGMAIQYTHDPRLNAPVIERVFSTTMADTETRDRHLRRLVIDRENVADGIIPPTDRPVRYSGIGAAIHPTSDGGGVLLQPLSPTAPAARAGLRFGDVVTAIDGVPVIRFTNTFDIARAIRGPEQTDVTLAVQYPDGTRRELKVRREVFMWTPPATP